MRCLIRVVMFLVCGVLSCGASEVHARWREIAPNILRTDKQPYAYAVKAGRSCLLIGAPHDVSPRDLPTDTKCELLLLTHHHRDSSIQAEAFIKAGIPVRAPHLSEDYLSPSGVAAYWKKSLPEVPKDRFPTLFERTWGDWTYLVHPTGVQGIRFYLNSGDEFLWNQWRIKVLATPGHSKDHVAFLATPPGESNAVCFCGDAIAAPGKIWSPYTVEWHHQKDEGAVAAATSLRAIAAAKPKLLLLERGEPIRGSAVVPALLETAELLQQLGAAKNFDAYTKSLDGPLPNYKFLAPDQVGTANPSGNPQPWTKLSEHLLLTGNTYALVSRDGPVLLMDPYSQNIVERVAELEQIHQTGPVEVALISHAHNDHYTGIFALRKESLFKVWTLDRIADVVDRPTKYLAPYVDPRPVIVDRPLKDGEVVRWHEYELKVHHLPGQTVFGLGLEVVVDGRRCLFTGDNFYHHEQYSGSGGWSGRNRGLPLGYAASAAKILSMKPDWILAEHGGAFEFNAEDFRRRRDFAERAAKLADQLSVHGDHRLDWDPQRVRVEPLVNEVGAERVARVKIIVNNPTGERTRYRVRRPGSVSPGAEFVWADPQRETAHDFEIRLEPTVRPGRHVYHLLIEDQTGVDPSDTFCILDVRDPK